VLEREQGINAFAIGFGPADAAVIITAGALKALNRVSSCPASGTDSARSSLATLSAISRTAGSSSAARGWHLVACPAEPAIALNTLPFGVLLICGLT
jgi:hypothetical protein